MQRLRSPKWCAFRDTLPEVLFFIMSLLVRTRRPGAIASIHTTAVLSQTEKDTIPCNSP